MLFSAKIKQVLFNISFFLEVYEEDINNCKPEDYEDDDVSSCNDDYEDDDDYDDYDDDD